MNIMRIVYDWPPPWDGLAPAPYELSSSQSRLGHKISVLCGRWPFAGDVVEIPDVTIRPLIREPLPGFLSITISPLLFFYYLYWRRKEEVDIIHCHGHFAIWIYWYRRFLKNKYPDSKELKTPLVAHFHNTFKGRWEKLLEQNKPIKAVSRMLSWPMGVRSDTWAVEVADACIFVSKDLRQEAIKYYNADPAKCFVVETGVNIELFTPIGPEELDKTRNELGAKQGDKIILNHGAMVDRKNIHLLLESLRFLPGEFKLVLVGPEQDEEYEDKLKEVTSKFDLGHRVIRVGYTPYPQIQIAHQAADVFVLPSDFEGLPKVVMQSLACGVPVLASGFETEEKINGLEYLTEISPEAIAKRILDVMETRPTVDLGLVRRKYSWNVMAKKVEAIYDKVLNR